VQVSKASVLAIFTSLLALVVSFLGPGSGDAEASRVWCYSDPIVYVGGKLLDFDVVMPLENVRDVGGTVVTQISVPKGTTVLVVFVDQTLYRHDVRVRYAGRAGTSSFPVVIETYVPSAKSFPVKITSVDTSGLLSLTATTEGTSNMTVRHKLTFSTSLVSLF
jgi:hypothetical protein